MKHELKILPKYFDAVAKRIKTFEIRKNDRNYQVGDTLILEEWDNGHYTGRTISRYVCYVYYGDGTYGVPDGWCVMSLKISSTKAVLDYVDQDTLMPEEADDGKHD